MAGGAGRKDVLLCNYTHMKCDPSVSCVCVDGAGDNDDSGEEGKLFTVSHTARQIRIQVTEGMISSRNKYKLENHHFKP